jgi:PleD family two-component response regulator
MLPKMSGLDLLKKIRAHEGMKHLPVIVFSNTYLSNMVQEAWKAGATKCLSKANCTPKQVIEVVRSLAAQPAGTPAAVAPRISPVVPEVPGAGDADDAFQADLRRTFFGGLPAALAACRSHLQTAAKSQDDSLRVKYLEELYRRVHTLTSNAGITGVVQIAQMADALEALLKELYEKPKSINA